MSRSRRDWAVAPSQAGYTRKVSYTAILTLESVVPAQLLFIPILDTCNICNFIFVLLSWSDVTTETVCFSMSLFGLYAWMGWRYPVVVVSPRGMMLLDLD